MNGKEHLSPEPGALEASSYQDAGGQSGSSDRGSFRWYRESHGRWRYLLHVEERLPQQVGAKLYSRQGPRDPFARVTVSVEIGEAHQADLEVGGHRRPDRFPDCYSIM